MSSNASPAPSSQPSHRVNYISFSAANPAAIHLLESLLHSNSAPQTLVCDRKTIGYQLQIPHPSNLKDPIWKIGAGSIVPKDPEILLCLPGDSLGSETARESISPLHASLFFIEPGALVLKAHCDQRSIIYERGGIYDEDVELRATGRETCVMRRAQNFLCFGHYRFVVEFTTKYEDQANGEEQSNELKDDDHGLYYPLMLVSAPMIYCATSYNVWLHPIPNTSRTSGVNIYTGEPVAVTSLWNSRMSRRARSLLHLACQYPDKPHKGVLGVIDVWCKHRRLSLDFLYPDKLDASLPCCAEVSYSTPLAKYNFRNMRWLRLTNQQILSYFYSTLSGLGELHRKKICHRRITPDSLLLVEDTHDAITSRNQPTLLRAFLSLPIDPLQEHSKSICVAPEIWKTESGKWDNAKADVWALAASWLHAFVRPPENVCMDSETHRILGITIDAESRKGFIQQPLASLLHQMLAFRPQDRPSVVKVLEHELWQPFREDRKRKRQERIQAHSDESRKAKKVEVLSPE
ncbi:kinase-like domain-containing protein [Trichoderma chlorosporum]